MKAAAVPLVLVPALGAVQGGFQPDAWVWSGALAAWAAAVAVIASDSPGMLRAQWPWLAATLAVLGWTALSAIWSQRSAQSILEARRAVAYAAVVLALVLLVRKGSERYLVLATCAATSGLVLYALFRYLLSARHYDAFEGFLLSDPLGYANAVGILTALALLLAFGIAAAESGGIELAAAALTPPLALALTLTGSDASWLALGAGLAIAALLLPAPQRYLTTLAAVALPCAALVVLGHFSRISDVVSSPRIGGTALALATVAGAACAGASAVAARRVRVELPRHLKRAVLVVVILLALGGAAAVAHAGATEPRASYWHVAWHDYTSHAALGSGAGTFGFAWVRSGKVADFGGALDAHSLYLETLAELGPIGLLLVALMLLVPLRAVRRAPRAPYVATAIGAYVAFLLHAGLDWDWEMPAVVVAGLGCGAAALAAQPSSRRPLSTGARVALVALALVLAGSAIAGSHSKAVPSAHAARAPQSGALA